MDMSSPLPINTSQGTRDPHPSCLRHSDICLAPRYMRLFLPETLLACFRLILLFAFCLFCTAANAQESLKVGLYQNPPKIFTNAKGMPAGFFVDILNAIATQEGWQLDYVECDWKDCLKMLDRGDIDLMPDVAYSKERDQRFDFHREVVLSNWALLYARNRRSFQSLIDLNNKPIAVIAGSIQYDALKKQLKEFDIKPLFIELRGSEETMQAVADGHADAALVNRLFGLKNADKYRLEPTHILINASQLYYATAEGRHADQLAAIDRHLGVMKADEKSLYHRALRRWVEPLETDAIPFWLIWLLEGLFILLLMLLLYSFFLKRAVHHKKSKLEQRDAALAESETMFRSLFETSADAMLLSRDGEVIDANPAMLHMFGYPNREALQRAGLGSLSPPTQPGGQNSRAAAEHYIQQAFDTGYAFFEWIHRRSDGTLFSAEVTLVPMQVQGKPVLQSTIRDISKRKRNEAHLQHLNRALHTLSRVNHILVHARDETELLDTICRTIVESGGYRLAWVGFARYDDARSIEPVAQYGFEDGYLDNLQISWKDDEFGRGPTGSAIRTGKPVIARNIQTDPRFAPWREQAAQRGYASSIALPLKSEAITFGALNIYSSESDAFDEEELSLLIELAADLSFGVHAQHLRMEQTLVDEKHKEHREQLQNSLLQTIQAITLMVEKRDPYTAGHQQRSSDLAVAIAEELQLDQIRIEGIRFASMIHDIGCLSIPSEILGRPGELTSSERSIVQSHVHVGYEIIKDIDFPWPVAQMIRQHHERLDGSGYPAGLTGDQIMFEARIIAVVDVIEAMLSDRPYRPALGLEATLKELHDNRGSKYDDRVVDVSLRLFTEKGYTLPT